MNDDRLYRGLDVLAAHKDKLCAHLMERYKSWFGVQFEFLLGAKDVRHVSAGALPRGAR